MSRRSELDQEARLEMLREVQRIISDDQPAIFLEHFKWFLPMSTRLTGYTLVAALVLGFVRPRLEAGDRIDGPAGDSTNWRVSRDSAGPACP